MGVPKFFVWLCERYPCISQVVTGHLMPEYENLYLDVNAIIHLCSHANEKLIMLQKPESQIFADICDYIQSLFDIVKPKKVFFIAIDGVAPRAKMNQQRGRRFTSARNFKEEMKKANRDEVKISRDVFDPNCITPGTLFMTRLHEHLRYFVATKITNDQSWQRIKIYLSGHNCPGEGEHKIMDFIRSERAQPDHDPNTRHCLYGADADLIMLSLCCHEPHFSLLREELKFDSRKKSALKKGNIFERTTFSLVHISLLREYISLEFDTLKSKLPFAFDLERLIDDLILLYLLVGNDFIPNLPNIFIHDQILPVMYASYIEVLPNLDGYINENGILNLPRFERFLKCFSDADRRKFLEHHEDSRYLASKQFSTNAYRPGQKINEQDYKDEDCDGDGSLIDMDYNEAKNQASSDFENAGAFDSDDEFDIAQTSTIVPEFSMPSAVDISVADLSVAAEMLECQQSSGFLDDNFSNNLEIVWTPEINRAFREFKKAYYAEKLKLANITKQQLRTEVHRYICAIQWNLHYYFHGCCSWNWFYAAHYSPFVSDIKGFSDMQITFDLSEPFRPFAQLLTVLPKSSGDLLPVPFKKLMFDQMHPISSFYPDDFETDMNGKKNDWESVVLLPFITEDVLVSAISAAEQELTDEERDRNTNGPHLLYTTNFDRPYKYCVGGSKTISNCIAEIEEIDMFHFRIGLEDVKFSLLDGLKLDGVNEIGFPTLQNKIFTCEITKASISMFSFPSRNPSLILHVQPSPLLSKEISVLATELIGTQVLYDWPVLKEGLVHEIWGSDVRHWKGTDGAVESHPLTNEQRNLKNESLERLSFKEKNRYGIDATQSSSTVVWIRPFHDMKYAFYNSHIGGRWLALPKKVWCKESDAIPASLSLIVEKAGLSDNSGEFRDIAALYPVNTCGFVVLYGSLFYGLPARVTETAPFTVACDVMEDSTGLGFLAENIHQLSNTWMPSHCVVARFFGGSDLNLPKYVFERMTSTVFLRGDETASAMRRMNIGLRLRISSKNKVVCDYVRSLDGCWLFSQHTAKLMADYMKKYPEIFQFLHCHQGADPTESEIWPDLEPNEREIRVQELRQYIANLSSSSSEMVDAEHDYVDSCAMEQFEKLGLRTTKTRTVDLIILPEQFITSCSPLTDLHSSDDIRLFDRVVLVRQFQRARAGSVATVVGLPTKQSHLVEVVEVFFDLPFSDGVCIRGSKRAGGAVVPMTCILNITHGRRKISVHVPNLSCVAHQLSNNHPIREHQTDLDQFFNSLNNSSPVEMGSTVSCAERHPVATDSNISRVEKGQMRVLSKGNSQQNRGSMHMHQPNCSNYGQVLTVRQRLFGSVADSPEVQGSSKVTVACDEMIQKTEHIHIGALIAYHAMPSSSRNRSNYGRSFDTPRRSFESSRIRSYRGQHGAGQHRQYEIAGSVHDFQNSTETHPPYFNGGGGYRAIQNYRRNRTQENHGRLGRRRSHL